MVMYQEGHQAGGETPYFVWHSKPTALTGDASLHPVSDKCTMACPSHAPYRPTVSSWSLEDNILGLGVEEKKWKVLRLFLFSSS